MKITERKTPTNIAVNGTRLFITNYSIDGKKWHAYKEDAIAHYIKKWIHRKCQSVTIKFNGQDFTVQYVRRCEVIASDNFSGDYLTITQDRQWAPGDYRQIENDGSMMDYFNNQLTAKDYMKYSLPYPMYALHDGAYMGNEGKHLVKIA